MSNLSNNLKQLIAEDDLNTSELARLTGILQPVMHRMVTGETDNPRVDTLLPIAKYFDITVEALVGAKPLQRKMNASETTHPLRYIPLLEWHSLVKTLNTTIDKASTPLIETTEPLSEQAYALKVKDSTMLPVFNEGALLLVDPTRQPENRDFVIASVETHSEPTFRQVFFDGSHVYLKPLNTEFKTIFLDKKSRYLFLGTVIEMKMLLKSS